MPRLPLLNQDRLALRWLDVRDVTNRPVPFWVRSEAGPTSWWEPGGPNPSARLTGAVVVVCGA